MTETVRPTLGTERHLVGGMFHALREDLFQGAFTFRPLAGLDLEYGRWLLLPDRVRARLRWLPQAFVVGAAGLIALLAYSDLEFGTPVALISAFLILFSLFRPVGAWWLSLPGSVMLTGMGWSPFGLGAHIVVMAVAASHFRPQVAAEMWFVTLVVGMWASILGGEMRGTLVGFLLVAAIVLLTVVALRGWQHARSEVKIKEAEVAVKEEVTLVERSRRTLLEERTTIARELHDVVAHHMSVVAIQAEAAPYRVEQAPPELEAAFVTIRENAVAALTELRRVLGVVRAEDYEVPDAPQPTLAALDGLLDNVREAGLRVEKAVTGAVREGPQGVELSAFRIIQEALSNALRHAPGAAARVELSYVLGGIGLRVVNEAPTSSPRPSNGAGHGLTGMRERVAMLDGEITAGPTADGGFEVVAFLPVARTEEPDPREPRDVQPRDAQPQDARPWDAQPQDVRIRESGTSGTGETGGTGGTGESGAAGLRAERQPAVALVKFERPVPGGGE